MEKPCMLAVIQSDLPLICELRTAWEESGRGKLRVARNAQEAVLYMRGVGIYSNREAFPVPDVVALDCSNSNVSDLEVLSWLRETPGFVKMPVALLCPENHPGSQTICALDRASFFVDRGKLDELLRVGEVIFSFAARERDGGLEVQA